MTGSTSRKPRGGAAPTPRGQGWITALGLLAATAPGWLFAIAAATAGPRTAVLIYGLPVLASTALAIWCSFALERRGARGIAVTVGVVALVVGAMVDVAWAYLAVLGIRFGDGPF